MPNVIVSTRRTYPGNKQHGFAMIEVLVTAIIFAIGISGMGVLLLKTIQSTQDNAQRSQGMWIVQDFIGRIRANPEAALTNAYEGSQASSDCKPATVVCATYTNGGDTVSECDAAQMATFDIWSSICGFDTSSTGKVFENPSEFLIEPELTSSCINPNAGAASCIEYNILLSWTTRQLQAFEETDDPEKPGGLMYKNTYEMNVEFN